MHLFFRKTPLASWAGENRPPQTRPPCVAPQQSHTSHGWTVSYFHILPGLVPGNSQSASWFDFDQRSRMFYAFCFIYLNVICLEDVLADRECCLFVPVQSTNSLLSLKVEHNLPAGNNSSVLNVLGVDKRWGCPSSLVFINVCVSYLIGCDIQAT